MKAPPIPEGEVARLEALSDLSILDTAPEPELDEIARIAARVAQAPIALVSLVDQDRQWFKARCGLEMGETPRTVSFCAHAILQTEPFIVSDTLKDDRFHDNPLVTAAPKIRFYAGFPLRSLGQPIGTLCILDRAPRTLSDRQLRLIRALARQVELQLEFRRREVAVTTPPQPALEEVYPEAPDEADSISFRIRLVPKVEIERLGGAFERLSGHQAEEFYADAEAGARLLHPDDRPLLGLALQAPAIFQRPLVLRWRTKSGRWLWLAHRFRLLTEKGHPLALEGTAHPVPAAADSRVGPLVTTEVVAHAPDVITIVDGTGAVRFESPAITDAFGYEPAELVGRNAFELVHPDDQPSLRAELASLLANAGSSSRRRYRLRHKNGSWRTVESVARNLTEDPTVRGVLIQTRDMSAWAEIERSLVEAQDDARQIADSRQRLIDDLRRVQESKQQLCALIVHDLKSPLSAIMANAQFILEDCKAAEMDIEPVQDVIDASETLHRMVMDILDVSRGETGTLTPKLAQVDVADLVERACDGVSGVLRGQRQELLRDVQRSRRGAMLKLDSSLIDRVLQNLLDNSSKYSPPGTTLAVRVRDDDDHVRIDVLDEGPGVPDAYKEKVFELYAQVDRDASKHARTSRGLGLAFCKMAVGAHGGRIWVEDRPEGGSAFCIELPRT